VHSLTLRFFLAFWLIIVALTALAGLAGYNYAERMREALENFEIEETALAASDALETDGRRGLERWLARLPVSSPVEVFVVDAGGSELLDRRIPRWAERLIHRFDDRRHDWQKRRRDTPNLLPARPLTRLRAPDGQVFTLFVSPKRHPVQEWMGVRAGPAFLVIAVLLSAGVSFVLARAISKPVRAMRAATVAIADGRLETRVAPATQRRKDEIGLLAQDLDRMAARLEAAARRQRELTRNVSHELRSPLARLRVALELARRQAGDLPEFGRIDEETERLDTLIGQLLSYARLDTGDNPVHELVDIAELLERLVDDANYECRSSGLDGVGVRLLTNDPGWVSASPAALSSAFENVLRNAIHHSPRNRSVDVQAAQEGEQVVVTVTDRGTGVADGDLEAIFEPFFRSGDAMSQDAPGSGLGLAIAARAVQTHGGTIRARNLEPGFVVEIRLPAAARG